jgi:hypothetical protein
MVWLALGDFEINYILDNTGIEIFIFWFAFIFLILFMLNLLVGVLSQAM